MSTSAPSEFSPLPAPGRVAALDGLRGVAIALVLWHHLVSPLLPPGHFNAVTNQGWMGVDLFFALSGFLIGGILMDHRASPRLMPVFYLRRGARILPLYYLALAAMIGAVLGGLPAAYHVTPLWVHPFFLTNFAFAYSGTWDWGPLSVLWSLAVEEQFYLAAPWLIRAVPPGGVGWLAAGLIGLSELLRVGALLASPGPHLFIHVLTPFAMDSLGCGILCAWMLRDRRADRTVAFLMRRRRWFLLAGAGLLLVLNRLHAGGESPPMALWGYLIVGAGCGLLVLIAVRGPTGTFSRSLGHPLLGHLGRRSYFVYLFHLLAAYTLAALFGVAPGERTWIAAGVAALAIATTWIAAEASWRWFEGPIVAWGHRRKY